MSWQWNDDGKWRAFLAKDVKLLEKAFTRKTKELTASLSFNPDQTYQFNFVKMTQTNEDTGMQRQIRRIADEDDEDDDDEEAPAKKRQKTKPTKTSKAEVHWEFQNDDGSKWIAYKPKDSKELEEAFTSNMKKLTTSDLSFSSTAYTFDFQKMFQRNNSTKTRRPIRRVCVEEDEDEQDNNSCPLQKTVVTHQNPHYSRWAGVNSIPVSKDVHGNADGTDYDLAPDHAYKGDKIVVLNEYHLENFDFGMPLKALKDKGFKVKLFQCKDAKTLPSPAVLDKEMQDATQLWLIATSNGMLAKGHRDVIKKHFNQGKGIYIWGDNVPYYVDANVLGKDLLGATMEGNWIGGKTVQHAPKRGKKGGGGFGSHLITTGLENLFEGVTVANIQLSEEMETIAWASDGKPLIAVYDQDGKRAMFDGGFTRLYISWNEAGTARYVKNAAAWLHNWEGRLGQSDD
eukprot:TRINITY_DN66777_c0_g3_i1.p1 TRINITY_DN66777_c0_g3~~TRINITY_DN66777_c0_g3_i1.p1  ORF type:complete len:456 (+),score=74.99 TRINITY_DN66777_c0_g3_i1:39-1406(+)